MATAFNKQLSDGTDEVDILSVNDVEDEILDHFDAENMFEIHQRNFNKSSWAKIGDFIEDELGHTFYADHDPQTFNWEDGFDYKEAIEKAKREGNDTVVAVNFS
jgi:hypothetical protein